MVSSSRSVLVTLLFFLLAESGLCQKYFPDDPIEVAPPPIAVKDPYVRDINRIYDFLYNSIRPDSWSGPPGGAINTLGNVPDSAWFTNRHSRHRMSREELQRGAGADHPPILPFTVISGKTGVTPGFEMRDSAGRLYFVKLDPVKNPEMATATEVIASKFLYAIGYNTPENYIVTAKLSDFRLSKRATLDSRQMTWGDFCGIISKTSMFNHKFRLVASLGLDGKPIGPFRFEGTRSDDPNDIVPHENRRDLRGLHVFAAWLNHTDVKGINSLDTVVQENGTPYIRHHLIDFGNALGSDATWPKDARHGNEFDIPKPGTALGRIFSLGLFPTEWEKAEFPDIEAVGNLRSAGFNPEKWKSNYPNPAFLHRLPDDEFWAAKTVMGFNDDDIRTIVETGRFSDRGVVDCITAILAERRDRIGRTYFSKVLPLDNFRVQNGELQFDDLAVKYGFAPPRRYTVEWFYLDNATQERKQLPGSVDLQLPNEILNAAAGSYYSVVIRLAGEARNTVAVDLRKTQTGIEVVGIERTW